MLVFSTGSSGLIGSRLRGSIPLYIDLTDPRSFTNLELESCSTIIHLAGVVGEKKVKSNSEYSWKVNVWGTKKFAQYIKENTDARFLYVSSSHVYRQSSNPHKEESPLGPKTFYGNQKLQAEEALNQVFKNESNRLLIARVFSVLDFGMPLGTLGWAIENLSAKSPLRYVDDVRDFLSPNEIAEKLRLVAQQPFQYEILNICSGRATSVREACVMLRKKRRLPTEEKYLIPGNSEVPVIVGSCEKFQSLNLGSHETQIEGY